MAAPARSGAAVVGAARAGAAVAGAPSTAAALVRREDVLAGAHAAGALLVGTRRPDAVLLAAAVPVHGALSLGWAAVLSRVLPPRAEPAWGAAAGLAIAAVDL